MAAEPVSRLNEKSIPDYFSLFGIPRRFGIDRAVLERRFYELSRETHPDRFAAAGPARLREAMERMSLLNEGYRVLKDPAELREYFLRIEGFDTPSLQGQGASTAAKQQIPMELAESWFELQDAVMEDPASARDRIGAFEAELHELETRGSDALRAIEAEIDAALSSGGPASRERLELLSRSIRSQSYLKSMKRDVERLKARFLGAPAPCGPAEGVPGKVR